MRALFILALIASPAFSEQPTAKVDVAKWFDGCVALVQEDHAGVAQEMDSICLTTAVDFCAFGNGRSAETACWGAFTTVLQKRSDALEAALPDVKDLTGFRKTQLARWKSEPDDTECKPPKGVDAAIYCGLLQESVRWSILRGLRRYLGGQN
ncbi:MAG: hypothetical protein N4A53_14190 [Pelagimonas sp.]|jgi:hypothetical protein|nr:hypothetical protein [Pelagimonas sp.]